MAKFVKKMFTWSIAPVYIADQEVDPPSRSDVSYCVLTQPSYLGWLSKPAAWEALQLDPLSCSCCFLFHSLAGAPKKFSCMITHAQTHIHTHTHTKHTQNTQQEKSLKYDAKYYFTPDGEYIQEPKRTHGVYEYVCKSVIRKRKESVAGVDQRERSRSRSFNRPWLISIFQPN